MSVLPFTLSLSSLSPSTADTTPMIPADNCGKSQVSSHISSRAMNRPNCKEMDIREDNHRFPRKSFCHLPR